MDFLFYNDTTLEADVENERVTAYNGDSVTGLSPSDSSVSDSETVALAISQSGMIADLTTDFPWVPPSSCFPTTTGPLLTDSPFLWWPLVAFEAFVIILLITAVGYLIYKQKKNENLVTPITIGQSTNGSAPANTCHV